MDREAWHAVIHVVAKSQTPLSDWTELKSRSGLASSSGMSVFTVLRNFHTLFLVAVPTQLQSCPQYRRILCFPRPQQQLTFVGRRWFLCRPFGRWIFCEVWGDTSLQFWLDFSKSDPEHLFMCFMAIWMPSLETHPFRCLWFFYWIDRVFLQLYHELHEQFACWEMNSLFYTSVASIYFPILRVVFFFL